MGLLDLIEKVKEIDTHIRELQSERLGVWRQVEAERAKIAEEVKNIDSLLVKLNPKYQQQLTGSKACVHGYEDWDECPTCGH